MSVPVGRPGTFSPERFTGRVAREMWELLHEIEAISASPSLQRPYALERLRDILRAHVSVVSFMRHGQTVAYEYAPLPDSMVELFMAPYRGLIDAPDVPRDIVLATRGALITTRQSDIFDPMEWVEQPLYKEICFPAAVGARLLSKRVVSPGVVEQLSICRGLHDPDFTQEEVGALRLFHTYYRFTPVAPDEEGFGLPERESFVLKKILDGASERAIAEALAVSGSLVRRITTNLYNQFDVKNRSELRGFFLSLKRPTPLPGGEVSKSIAMMKLSPRECEVVTHLATGASEAATAEALGMSFSTVHDHVKSIYRKLDVKSRGELMARIRGT